MKFRLIIIVKVDDSAQARVIWLGVRTLLLLFFYTFDMREMSMDVGG